MHRTALQVLLVAILAIGVLGTVGPTYSYGAFSDAHDGHANFTASTNFQFVADAGGPYEQYEDNSIELDGTDSTGNIESYLWEIIDGRGTLTDETTSTPVYEAPADVQEDTDVTVELTITGGGESDTDQATITVRDSDSGNSAPVARFSSSRNGDSPNVDLDASSSSDPDGAITSYEWDTDDDGSYEEIGQTIKVKIPSGTDVTLRVTDNQNATDTLTKSV